MSTDPTEMGPTEVGGDECGELLPGDEHLAEALHAGPGESGHEHGPLGLAASPQDAHDWMTRLLDTQTAASVATARWIDATDLLREWMRQYYERPDMPAKLDDALHVRTALFLALVDMPSEPA